MPPKWRRCGNGAMQRAKTVTETFESDGRVSGTHKGGNKIVLTRGTGEAPYRITTIDDKGPSGHRDYNSLEDAATEFTYTAIDPPRGKPKAPELQQAHDDVGFARDENITRAPRQPKPTGIRNVLGLTSRQWRPKADRRNAKHFRQDAGDVEQAMKLDRRRSARTVARRRLVWRCTRRHKQGHAR